MRQVGALSAKQEEGEDVMRKAILAGALAVGTLMVKRAVVFPERTLTAVTALPGMPVSVRSLVWTDAGLTGSLKFRPHVD